MFFLFCDFNDVGGDTQALELSVPPLSALQEAGGVFISILKVSPVLLSVRTCGASTFLVIFYLIAHVHFVNAALVKEIVDCSLIWVSVFLNVDEVH